MYSSNLFAIVGLRSLYTILANAVKDLKYLRPAVAIVLGFIGVKIGISFYGIEVGDLVSLAVVVCLLSGGVIASLLTDEDRQNA